MKIKFLIALLLTAFVVQAQQKVSCIEMLVRDKFTLAGKPIYGLQTDSTDTWSNNKVPSSLLIKLWTAKAIETAKDSVKVGYLMKLDSSNGKQRIGVDSVKLAAYVLGVGVGTPTMQQVHIAGNKIKQTTNGSGYQAIEFLNFDNSSSAVYQIMNAGIPGRFTIWGATSGNFTIYTAHGCFNKQGSILNDFRYPPNYSGGSFTYHPFSFMFQNINHLAGDNGQVNLGAFVIGEEFTSDGTTAVIPFTSDFTTGTIAIYRNGIRLKKTLWSETGPNEVTLTFTPNNGDEFILDYQTP